MSTEIDIANCEDEQVLSDLVNKTNDMNLRKQIRSRQKELRDREAAAALERKKQREATGTNLDSVKTRAKQAEEEKAKKMAGYQDQAKFTIGASSAADPVKAKHERAMKDKESQMKQYDELAKSGGAASYQGGLESVNQMELKHKEMEKARIMKQFDNMQQASKKRTAAPKKPMNMFKAMDKATAPATQDKPNVIRNPGSIKQLLLEWCKRKTQGYQGVDVQNFSGSWANGLAFCALIHHFYPDSFDFSQLKPQERRKNLQLAFDTAEKLADIAPLLDVDDMIMMKDKPDWKCVFTYIQGFYRRFKDTE